MLDRRSIRARPWHLWHGREPLRGNKQKRKTKREFCIGCVAFMIFEYVVSVSRVCMSLSLFSLLFLFFSLLFRSPSWFHARFFARTREFVATLCILSSLSQRPTHSGSIFRLLLKIAVGLPRSCDSRNFCRASALTITTTAKDEMSVCV